LPTEIAFVAPPFLGHLNPMLALARELVGRGHRATFLHMEDARSSIREDQVAFRAIGQRSHPPGRLQQITDRMARIETLFGIGGIVRDMADTTDMLCRELPAALREIGADLVISDGTEAAGGLVATSLGLPYVSVANALPLNREPTVPPPFTAWRYDPSRWGVERNLGGYRSSDWLMGRLGEVISAYAAKWGLGPRRTIEDTLSPLAQISQLVRGFDMPRSELPATFHYCGPLRTEGRDVAGFDWRPTGGRPLVFASLGTLQGSRATLFRRIARAAERLELELVLAHGGKLSAKAAASLPGRPAVFDFVPQEVVLRHSSIAVLNGGLNTVMDAMAAGVPVAAVPIAFEQGAIARRLERVGAGRMVGRRFSTAGRFARAIAQVLGGHNLWRRRAPHAGRDRGVRRRSTRR
jgi:zeaxanthin glucosyltransferase